MLRLILKYYLVLLLMNYKVRCEDKASLTFVIDITGSMHDDIWETIEASQKVLRMAVENNSSVIENFVLVTFSDPEYTTEIITQKPNEFSNALENLLPRVGGGGDCPEMSMSGIEAALEASLPGSFIYVFTDAVAKDFYKVETVKSLAQKKQSRVIFLLTGMCGESRDSIDYQVYHQVAAVSSGQVYHLLKNEVGMVLDTIPALIIGRSTVLTSQLLSSGCNPLNFRVDSKTRDVTISASGEDIRAENILAAGFEVTNAEILLHTSNIIIIKIKNPAPGDYQAKICSDSTATVVVNGKTDFDFKHGFSVGKPRSLRETMIQPFAGIQCHLAIDLMNPENDVVLKAVEVLDVDEKLLFVVPVHAVDKDFYISELLTPPDQIFKVAITGIDKNSGSPIRRISKTAIEPIIIKTPTANDNPNLSFTCGFSSNIPKSFKETLIQPTAGVPCHMAIDLINPENDIGLTAADILDIHDNFLFDVPVYLNDNGFYNSDIMIPPEHPFKVAIKGFNKNSGSPIRQINETTIEPLYDTSIEVFNFTAGFLSPDAFISKLFGETERQPIADVPCYLTLDLINPTKDVQLNRAEILDVDDNLLFQIPIYPENYMLYISPYDINLPHLAFKIAVKGIHKGSPIRKINETVFEPQNVKQNLNFICGFSTDIPKSIKDTSEQPTAGIPCHLAIDLLKQNDNINLTTAEILDTNDTVLFKVPVHSNNTDFYISDIISPPDHAFKVAIEGVDKISGSPIRKISETVIIPLNDTSNENDEMDFNFTMGFLPNIPKSIEETETLPTAGLRTHLAIDLNNPEKVIELTTVEILDDKNNTLFEVPVQNENEDFYITDIITPPDQIFKVAIKGVNKNTGLPIKKISEPIKPKPDIKFKHGFTSRIPKSFDETSRQPTAGIPGRLAIDLMSPENDVKLKTVEVLDDHDNVLFEVPVHSDDKNFYISDPITAPEQTFKVAVKGIDERNGTPIRKISDTAVEPLRNSKPPKIDKSLTQLRLNPRSTHKLTCPLMEGYPEPIISWYYKVHGSSEYVKLKGVEKTIKIVANGIADLYRCTADNEYGHDYKDIKVFVNYKPKFIFPRKGRKPGLKMDVTLGEAVTLPCDYRGQPKPTSKWKKDGKDLATDTHYAVQPDHSLRFTADVKDSGIYTCIATNQMGSSRMKFPINVVDPKVPKSSM